MVFGGYGVELFFLLSGFPINLIRKVPFFADFMRRRVRRIYPLFLTVFVIELSLNYLLHSDKLSGGMLRDTA